MSSPFSNTCSVIPTPSADIILGLVTLRFTQTEVLQPVLFHNELQVDGGS